MRSHALRIALATAIIASFTVSTPAFAEDGPQVTPAPTAEATPQSDAPVSEPSPENEPAPEAAAGTPTAVGGVSGFAPGVTRLQGADRYATAVAISKKFLAGVTKVYIATGTNYPDALSASSVAGAEGVPLLLVQPDSIPPVVWNELVRLAPAQIVIAGGANVVSDGVLEQLAGLAPTTRVSGADRFGTSRQIAAQGQLTGTTTYIATGLNFPDALSAAAAAGSAGGAVVLVNGGGSAVGGETLSTLTQISTASVRIAGSSVSVSDGVASSLSGYPTVRYAGKDRFETAALLNQDAFSFPSTVFLALGTNFPDALAGGALAAATDAPLLISQADCIPPVIADLIDSWSPTSVVVLGSTAALSSNVANLVRCSAPAPTPGAPSNPGNSVNCDDFSTWAEAQAWFNTYYPYYGDVALLDSDNDLIACESLPGAP